MVSVAVYAEGPTEWFVARKLWKGKILNGMGFFGHDERSPTEMFIGGGVDALLGRLVDPSGKKGILISPLADRILLMFDQENASNLEDDVKFKIEMHLQKLGIDFELRQHDDFTNVFTGEVHIEHRALPVAIHVADKEGPAKNKDFDGYIVELLQSHEGVSIVREMLNDKKVTKITALRKPEMAEVVHQIGGQNIPSLIEGESEEWHNKWPIKRSKTILYSHITAMQLCKSHVHFSEDVVEKSDEQCLRRVFAPLIAAWNALKKEDDV